MLAIFLKTALLLDSIFTRGQEFIADRNDNHAAAYAHLPAVKTYLSTEVASTGFGGKAYCAYEVLGGETEQLYLWVLCQEYYRKEGAIAMGTAESLPIALTFEEAETGIKIISHQHPRSGTLYAKDLPIIFPRRVRDRFSQGVERQNNRVNQLQAEIAAEVESTAAGQ